MYQHQYFALHKPYGMVSQFVSSHNVPLLGELDFDFPTGTHAIGRLDAASEGLLLLTTNPKITKLLFQGGISHTRTYLVLVKKQVTSATLAAWEAGVEISAKGGTIYTTLPCKAALLEANNLVTYTQDVLVMPPFGSYSWITLTLTEGKFHQVRKMVGVLGHACRRLIRVSIEQMVLGDLPPGQVRIYSEEDFFSLLQLPKTNKYKK